MSVYCGIRGHGFTYSCGWNSIVAEEHAASTVMMVSTYRTTQYCNPEESEQSLQQNSENVYVFKF
jgi:hypothetical protein